jgi:putative glutamine amidotransferase
MRPAIGICTALERARWSVWDQETALLAYSYLTEIARAGGMALMIPPDPYLVENPDDALDRVDGLVLAGGADIDPSNYGAVPHAETRGTVPARDRAEIALARRAIERDMPVLGICRGMQLINIALGGTLHQHVPDVVGNHEHRRAPGTFVGSDHPVDLQDGSLAARAAGELQHNTKSHHHQAVDRLGDGLVVTGTSAFDGLVETIELPSRRFVLGVQWHPEADQRSRIIGALVAEARQRSSAPAAV